MSEKRFVPIFDGFDKRIVGAKDNGVIISFMDMFDLLNKLSEENQHFRQILDLGQTDAKDVVNVLNIQQEKIRTILKENKELKTELLDVLNQLFNAESSLIYEYSTNIDEDEKELKEHFKQKYGKYGWEKER